MYIFGWLDPPLRDTKWSPSIFQVICKNHQWKDNNQIKSDETKQHDWLHIARSGANFFLTTLMTEGRKAALIFLSLSMHSKKHKQWPEPGYHGCPRRKLGESPPALLPSVPGGLPRSWGHQIGPWEHMPVLPNWVQRSAGLWSSSQTTNHVQCVFTLASRTCYLYFNWWFL